MVRNIIMTIILYLYIRYIKDKMTNCGMLFNGSEWTSNYMSYSCWRLHLNSFRTHLVVIQFISVNDCVYEKWVSSDMCMTWWYIETTAVIADIYSDLVVFPVNGYFTVLTNLFWRCWFLIADFSVSFPVFFLFLCC